MTASVSDRVSQLMRATVPNSRKTGFYTLDQHPDGSWSCSCPAWKNQHLDPSSRRCKHMDQLSLSLGGHVVGIYQAEKTAREMAAG